MRSRTISKFNAGHITAIVICLRLIVGCVFIVSGISKAIDIFGFIFKIEEYLSVWEFGVPRPLVVLAAILLSGGEFTLGVLLASGAYKRVSVWLLLLQMAFMLPLTAYIWIANPVSDCGCFGEFIKISNGATFVKNIIVSLLLLYLFFFNTRVKGVYHAYTQWMVVAVTSISAITVALYGYNIQPLVDFRSFPVGTSLVDENDTDDTEFEYVYSKDGHKQTFTIEALPDSSWTFVERLQTTGREIVETTELNVYDKDGENVTADVIASEGKQLIIVIPQYERADVSGTYAINELQRYLERIDGSIIELIATEPENVDTWIDRSMASLPVYIAEETVLKELSRGNISAVYLDNGIIKWKRILAAVDVDAVTAGKISLDAYSSDGTKMFWALTAMLFFMLVVIYIIDAGRKLVLRPTKVGKSRLRQLDDTTK